MIVKKAKHGHDYCVDCGSEHINRAHRDNPYAESAYLDLVHILNRVSESYPQITWVLLMSKNPVHWEVAHRTVGEFRCKFYDWVRDMCHSHGPFNQFDRKIKDQESRSEFTRIIRQFEDEADLFILDPERDLGEYCKCYVESAEKFMAGLEDLVGKPDKGSE